MTEDNYVTETILMNSDLIEDLILDFLWQNNLISERDRAIAIDLALPVTDSGMVEVDVIYETLDDEAQEELSFE